LHGVTERDKRKRAKGMESEDRDEGGEQIQEGSGNINFREPDIRQKANQKAKALRQTI